MDEFSIHIKTVNGQSFWQFRWITSAVPLGLVQFPIHPVSSGMAGSQFSDPPGPWRMIVLQCDCWDRTPTSSIPELVKITHHHCWQAGQALDNLLIWKGQQKLLDNVPCCFLARNPHILNRQGGLLQGKDIPNSQCKIILLESNSQLVIKIGLNALIQKLFTYLTLLTQMYPKEYCLTDYNIMKVLGMDPSRKSTHYLITLTTFTHHSLAETWNFVASVTGTQVFTCATNFKLFVKSTVKKKRKKSMFLSVCTEEAVLVQNCHSAFPFIPQSLHAGKGSPFVPCPSYSAVLRRKGKAISFFLQGKPLAARTQDKGETRTKPPPVLSPTPQGHGFLPNSGPPSGGDWGQCWEKLLSPRRSYWVHFRVCNPQVLQLFLIFPLWEAAQHLQPALGTGRKLLKGGVPSFAELWTIRIRSWVELQGPWDHPDYEQSAGMNIPVLSQDGQSLLDSVYLQQSTGCAEIVQKNVMQYFQFWTYFYMFYNSSWTEPSHSDQA